MIILKKYFWILSVLAIAIGCSPKSLAAVIATLSDNVGSPSSVTINQGDSFTFTLNVASTAGEKIAGVTIFLTSPSLSSQFSITGRDNTGSIFTDLQTSSNTTVYNAANALLDPQNNNDLGASVADFSTAASGTSFVSTFTLKNTGINTPSGAYLIQLSSNSVAFDDSFNSYSLATTTPYTVNVTVVPEPSSYAMMGVGLLIFGGVFLKRQSAKS